jgi:uncharacterized protein YbjT (DUF2867 family)
MRILVAGATGYLGRHVVAEVGRRGHHVRALVRDRSRAPAAAAEVFAGEATLPATLAGACDGIDAVFSSLGITRQKDGLTYRDVDYQANVNLLAVARAARVARFVYVSIFDAERLGALAIVRAHEDFVAELRAAPLSSTVLRPTGYFSDMDEFLAMAKRGRAWIVGSGETRMNPIDGADLAVRAADALVADALAADAPPDLPVGGPEVLTIRQIAETAFAALGTRPRIRSLPLGVIRAATAATRIFSPQTADLIAFQTAVLSHDLVAPPFGRITLAEHFRERLAQPD